ncbi:MAG TPA: aldo/keto reductase [Polyangiales bacterium]|nr:aldo/keto reductase [Polyangiales bacterium]
MAKLPHSNLDVFPLCLGGNVFGWTANEAESFAVLDAYAEAGGNFIDSADVYSAWVPGNKGGESERILGRWMAARKNRAKVMIATKVGAAPGRDNLKPATIRAAVEDSLERLQSDYIDLYYAHQDDANTPQEETAHAFDVLVKEGKVRDIAASNFKAARLASALELSKRHGLARYVAVQPQYNLVDREYEQELQPLCEREGVACIPYYSLARGFLSGKYRPGAKVQSPRAEKASEYLDDRGLRVLGLLDELAAQHAVPVSAIALAWLKAQPTVLAPIASARTTEQLRELVELRDVVLDAGALKRLNEI